ncbi:hypothetical protein [Mesorhizobium sp.]|uniref:hypothetical protein n=1 Tax=Mesorhizobium sp. TaxID=1871066 RepID=UPI000FEA739F|nr:hypothetical protein [Mesorhizobium sp.]RWE96810.1 MAG: hypothetical protein EOS68_16795 [Mesorhizobium sp.]TIX59155.1 MAG: hypothetical protein E5V28_07845 [Mesorhizobium sp.]TIY11474.1 MAG: hypothetical protein E5V16_05265 [Mesorhizobium sp.]
MSAAERAKHLDERGLRLAISVIELWISISASRLGYWRDLGMSDEKIRIRLGLLHTDHHTMVDTYERRFGELPRRPLGSVVTSGAF